MPLDMLPPILSAFRFRSSTNLASAGSMESLSNAPMSEPLACYRDLVSSASKARRRSPNAFILASAGPMTFSASAVSN